MSSEQSFEQSLLHWFSRTPNHSVGHFPQYRYHIPYWGFLKMAKSSILMCFFSRKKPSIHFGYLHFRKPPSDIPTISWKPHEKILGFRMFEALAGWMQPSAVRWTSSVGRFCTTMSRGMTMAHVSCGTRNSYARWSFNVVAWVCTTWIYSVYWGLLNCT